jgi:flagellar protein FliO/FliZ
MHTLITALVVLLPSAVISTMSQAVEAVPEVVPQVGKHVENNMDAMSMILAMVMVLGLIVISAMVLKRFQSGASQIGGLKVITSLHLGTKERLVVVQIGQQQVLLGVTAQQISLLDKLNEPLSPGSQLSADMAPDIKNSLLKLFKK